MSAPHASGAEPDLCAAARARGDGRVNNEWLPCCCAIALPGFVDRRAKT